VPPVVTPPVVTPPVEPPAVTPPVEPPAVTPPVVTPPVVAPVVTPPVVPPVVAPVVVVPVVAVIAKLTGTVYFAANSVKIPNVATLVAKTVALLMQSKNHLVTLSASTDPSGVASYNAKLSHARQVAVRYALITALKRIGISNTVFKFKTVKTPANSHNYTTSRYVSVVVS